MNEALSVLGIQDDPYKLLSAENLQVETVKEICDRAFEMVQGGVSQEAQEKLLTLWDYLAKSDPLEKSDLIFVFGGGQESRPREAAKLYKEGWAPKILFTGQKAAYMDNVEITEAEKFAKIAIAEGVPEQDIILEKEAINTVENVTKSIELLKNSNQLPNKIILIQVEYQSRRAYLSFKAVADWNPEIICHPAPSAKFKRETYFNDKDAWSYVFNEFIKIYGARVMKHF